MKKLLILLTFIPLIGFSQQKDTVKCIMLVCDTARYLRFTDTALYAPSYNVYWQFGYEVREKHNTAENSIDPGFYSCIDKYGNPVSCWRDYYVHLYYLDDKKKPLNKNIVVWQSK